MTLPNLPLVNQTPLKRMDDVVLEAMRRAEATPKLSFTLKPSWSSGNISASSTKANTKNLPAKRGSGKTKKSLSMVQLRDLAQQLAFVHNRPIQLSSESSESSCCGSESDDENICVSVPMSTTSIQKSIGKGNSTDDVFMPDISDPAHSRRRPRRISSIVPSLSTINENGASTTTNKGYSRFNSSLSSTEACVRNVTRKWVLKALDREFKEENKLLKHMQSNLEGWDPVRRVYRFSSNNVPLRTGPKVNFEEIYTTAESFKERIALRSKEDHHLYGGSALNEVPHYFEVTNGYAKAKMEKLQNPRNCRVLRRRKSHQQLIDIVKSAISKPDLEEALKRLDSYQKKIVDNNFNFTPPTKTI